MILCPCYIDDSNTMQSKTSSWFNGSRSRYGSAVIDSQSKVPGSIIVGIVGDFMTSGTLIIFGIIL